MGLSLRVPFVKVLIVAVAVVASVAVAQGKANAEPVLSSWYGPGLAGNYTASGEIFDPYDYTAASPYLPFGTELLVCYQGCVTVRVTDRGPYAGGREMDLSQGAAEAVGLTAAGVDYVDVTVIGAGGY